MYRWCLEQLKLLNRRKSLQPEFMEVIKQLLTTGSPPLQPEREYFPLVRSINN